MNWAARSSSRQTAKSWSGGGWEGSYEGPLYQGAMALVRYNTNGSLDTTFGTGGEVINTGMTYNNAGR